jgi:hypothetical protein
MKGIVAIAIAAAFFAFPAVAQNATKGKSGSPFPASATDSAAECGPPRPTAPETFLATFTPPSPSSTPSLASAGADFCARPKASL